MEKFTPQKIDLAAINEGNRYVLGGGISPDAINRPIEASAYAQEIAESVKGLALNQPDSSQAGIVGTPTVEISGTGENAKFVFKGLKGERGLTGPSGVASGTVNSNAEGTSDTDGYTQQAVNKIASRPNLIINPDFSINQRGQKSYNSGGYTFDRWQLYNTGNVVENLSNGYGIKLSAPSTIASQVLFQQKIEININHLLGKTLTVSAKISGYVATNNNYQIICRCHNTESYGGNITSATIDVTRTGILSASVTVPSNTLSISVLIRSSGQVSGDYIDIDWIKLEVGSVATEFIPPLIAEELPKCKRYYQRFTTKSDYREYGIGFIASTTTAHIMIPLGGEMRLDNPTLSVSDISHFTVRFGTNVGNLVQTTISKMELRAYLKSGFFVTATLANTLDIEYGVASLRSANTDGYISLNAEIY